MKKFLYWTPRILSILLVAFTSLFAFDIFSEGYSGWELAIGLLMHLLPTLVAIIIIIVAWKWEHIGAWFFIALSVAYLFIGGFELIAILVFSVPFALIGVLFLLHYYKYVKSTERIDLKGNFQ